MPVHNDTTTAPDIGGFVLNTTVTVGVTTVENTTEVHA